MNAFQEWPQVESCRLYTKFTARPDSIAKIPFYVEKVGEHLFISQYHNVLLHVYRFVGCEVQYIRSAWSVIY